MLAFLGLARVVVGEREDVVFDVQGVEVGQVLLVSTTELIDVDCVAEKSLSWLSSLVDRVGTTWSNLWECMLHGSQELLLAVRREELLLSISCGHSSVLFESRLINLRLTYASILLR